MSKREIECKQKCPWFYPSVNLQIQYLDILADREHSVLSALEVHGEHWFSVGAVSERESRGGATRSVRLLWTLNQQLRRDAEGVGSVNLVFPAICGEGHRKSSISLQSILWYCTCCHQKLPPQYLQWQKHHHKRSCCFLFLTYRDKFRFSEGERQ